MDGTPVNKPAVPSGHVTVAWVTAPAASRTMAPTIIASGAAACHRCSAGSLRLLGQVRFVGEPQTPSALGPYICVVATSM